MAISMRSLANNSFDEDVDLSEHIKDTSNDSKVSKTTSYTLTTNTAVSDSTATSSSNEVDQSQEDISEKEDFVNQSINSDYIDKNFLKKRRSLDLRVSHSNDESKSHWLKEQVSGSFKRLSARISPGNSLDNSLSESFDGDGKLKQSKSLSDGGLSKKEKVKEQFNSYFNKSKKYYQQSVSQTENEASPSLAIPIVKTHEEKDDEISISNDKNTSPIAESKSVSTPVQIQRSSSPAVNVSSSFSYDDNYLPFISNPPESNLSKSPSRSLNHSILNSNSDSKSNKKETNKLIKSKDKEKKDVKLAFSELLQFSDKSPLQSPSTPEPPPVMEKTVEVEKEIGFEPSIEQRADRLMQEDLKYHMNRKQSLQISFTQLWLSSLLLFLYMLSFLPSYLTGFISGALFMFLMFSFTLWLISPSVAMYSEYKKDLKEFIADSDSKEEILLEIKNLPKPENLQKPRDLKGWMGVGKNYEDYNFQKELNQDVYAVIHQEFLFVFISKENIDKKMSGVKLNKKPNKNRKTTSDTLQNQSPAFMFEEQWTINLSKCEVKLKPDDLPIRRMWNKKYPMKLIIPTNELIKRKIDLSLEDLTLGLNDIIEGVDLNAEGITINTSDEMFYLFGNTGREKEDWFYRIQLCVKPLKHQFGVDDTSLTSEPRHSYPHYMVELITESEKVMQRNEKGKKMEPYLAWLNIFLGRAFWDFWHDQYWTNKLHQKIQTRLSKINTPPFITNITLKDLNCGHSIPIIHKGSIPALDEYGVWTDLQITYKGYFTLTLETQLNVDYYVELVSSIVKQKAGVDVKNHTELSKLTKMSEIQNDSLSPSSEENIVDDVNKLHEELEDVYFEDEVEPLDPLMKDPRTKAFLESRAGKKVVGVVGWIAKSKLAKRVAETDFAKKAYEKAYEKFRKMPIVLKVEIQSVRGNLAVNIPPPPTNRVWFGFRGNPVIFITASPKVGDKQVRLTYLTNWIEKKLKEEFKKYLVLPSMQDLSIKLMDSQLATLYPDRPTS